MTQSLNRVSSQAVLKATGRSWDQWLALLDGEGAGKMKHKEIASLLQHKGYIASPWWRQTVATGYEQARGLRVAGETAAAGFEIGVRKTFSIDAREAWEIVTGSRGLAVWLGDVSGFEMKKGNSYRTAGGASGEIRSVSPGRRLRLTWQPAGWPRPSTLQVTVVPSGEKTVIAFHQENLASEKVREEMRLRWQEVLEKLDEVTGGAV